MYRQQELREEFCQRDAICRLNGYEPSNFEQRQRERLIVGDIKGAVSRRQGRNLGCPSRLARRGFGA